MGAPEVLPKRAKTAFRIPLFSIPILIYRLELYFSCISVRVRVQFYFEDALYLFIYLNDVYIWLIFPHLYVLSVTVLTWWVAPHKMFCNWYRIYWSRNQLWNCTHFRHPTDEQLRHVDIYFLAATIIWPSIYSLSTLNSKKENPRCRFKLQVLSNWEKMRVYSLCGEVFREAVIRYTYTVLTVKL